MRTQTYPITPLATIGAILLALTSHEVYAATPGPTIAERKAVLGEALFNDDGLSSPEGHSCASCHQETMAFTDGQPVSFGMFQQQGTRNASSVMYLKYSPAFSYDKANKTWVGGQFWDGRANSFQDQAMGPLFNPIEMNNTPEGLAKRLRASPYFIQLQTLYGKEQTGSTDGLINAVTDTLAHFQSGNTFSPFTSKYDYVMKGEAQFTQQELLGKALFEGKAQCTNCHSGVFEGKQLFTAFLHHNILTPKNPNLPVYYENKTFVDLGTANHPALSAKEKAKAQGKFRTPSLRNVNQTSPYMHNGIFFELKETVQYHLTTHNRTKWGPPEAPQNPSLLLTNNVALKDVEMDALVAYLKTLDDGFNPPSTVKE